ncbi:hypothetical protein CTAYLR_008733 [Chrysophaeum taylorii]|uniref:Uncharacterized protein n=1 Tax=Chrysophaeum taylorii TaxID=2483200 RepID=A0AAD7UL04_9STRA|nr:hypothetical protein CTAYLR_008733 [Chrysophaeum taylorii]
MVSRRRAASLDPAARNLDFRLRRDLVNQLLWCRPDPGDLREARVLDAGAPRLHSAARALDRALRRDAIRRALGFVRRINGRNVSPVIQAARKSLDLELRKAILARSLRRRPEPDAVPRAEYVKPGKRVLRPSATMRSNFGQITDRHRFGIALDAAARLYGDGRLRERARLKDLILDTDARIATALDAFWLDNDTEALLDSLNIIVVSPRRAPRCAS